VPLWLAVAIAASSPLKATPLAITATAWNGFMQERGKIGDATSPRERSTSPSPVRTTAEPACRDSTKPLRSMTANSTASATAMVPVAFVPDTV
jgi:hypothetical protein